MYSKTTLIGHLGKDPETRYTGSGQAVCNFSVATSETFKNRAGEKQTKTEWHRIVIWGKLAEIAQKYCKKGQLVLLEGTYHTRSWEDRENTKRYSFELTANTLKMLGGKKDSAGSSSPESDSAEDSFNQPGESAPMTPQTTGPDISDEDIPF